MEADSAMVSGRLDRLGIEFRREAVDSLRAAAAEVTSSRQRSVAVVEVSAIDGELVAIMNLGQAGLGKRRSEPAHYERNSWESLVSEESRIWCRRGKQPAKSTN